MKPTSTSSSLPDPVRGPAPGVLVAVARVAALIGLAASVALLVDYLRPAPAFCTDGGGCATVRESAWSHPLGVPMPVFGVAFFAAAVLLSLAPAARGGLGQRLLRWHATIGAVIAASLLIVQGAVIGAWCKLCVVTDTSALALAATVWLAGARPWRALSRRGAFAGGLLAIAAAGIPIAIGAATPPPGVAIRPLVHLGTPAAILRDQKAGVVTVVDFVDFECPFCRRLHPRLEAALKAVGGPVRVVRKMVPLSQHRHALPAAAAWCCADEQGKGDAMAEALFSAPPDELTMAGCEKLAVAQGVDASAFRTCMTAPRTKQRIVSDLDTASAVGLISLPTVYIGDQVFVGADATQAMLETALRRAIAKL